MYLIRSTARTAVLAVVGLLAAACGGDASLSSVGPSSASAGASITGLVRGSAVTPAPSRSLGEETFTALDSRSGVTISVVGTGISTNADNQGQFTLNDVPAGTVVLNFSAPGSNATATLQGVGPGDRVQITVTVNGNNAHIDSEHHNNGEISARITSIESGNKFQAGNWTIQTTGSTVIRHGSKTLQFSNLEVGDDIQVRGTRDGSTVTATEIKVEDGNQNGDNDDDDNEDEHGAEVEGKVSGLLNSNSNSCPNITFMIGNTKITAGQSTTYRRTSCDAIKNDLKVEVEGTKQSDGSVLARRISLDD